MTAFQKLPLLDTGLEALRGADGDAALLAGRVDILYRASRYHLFIPFAAMTLAALLNVHFVAVGVAVAPVLLQVAIALATGLLVQAYARRSDNNDDPRLWADRYVIVSAQSGLAWGIGAVVWFQPHVFSSQAFLVLGFLGLTATEFIGRCAWRPAYLAFAVFSLGPLALMLFREMEIYAAVAGLIVIFFGCLLYRYCGSVAETIGGSLLLRRQNTLLIARLAREKLEAEKQRDLAQSSAQAKTVFIAGVSHEIRTPLNALLGMTQLLERSTLDRTQRSHVKVLLDAGYGLKTLLDDVMALSGGDHCPASDEDCDPAQAARTVARLLQPRAWEKRLRLSVTVGSDLPRVAVDPRCLRQILLKLVDNAIRFTRRGSVEVCVDVRIGADGSQHLLFQVIDTGFGIPPDIANDIFEPFVVGNRAYSKRQEGTGLGLAVAKGLVEEVGGEIGFESETGEGTRFWFTIPAVRADTKILRENAAIAGNTAPLWGHSILLWMPDEKIRSHIADLLEPFGNAVSMPADKSTALALACKDSFDAIIVWASDADFFVAAPGVKAPVLGLVRAGMRAPEAAAGALHWPSKAGLLYATLRNMLGRAADPDIVASYGSDGEAAAIDAPAFAALERSLGIATLVEILQSYMETAEQLCAALEAAARGESWNEAARIAQDIAGAAGGLGLAALTDAARGFTQKARAGTAPPVLHDAAENIVGEHHRVQQALAELYPDLAA